MADGVAAASPSEAIITGRPGASVGGGLSAARATATATIGPPAGESSDATPLAVAMCTDGVGEGVGDAAGSVGARVGTAATTTLAATGAEGFAVGNASTIGGITGFKTTAGAGAAFTPGSKSGRNALPNSRPGAVDTSPMTPTAKSRTAAKSGSLLAIAGSSHRLCGGTSRETPHFGARATCGIDLDARNSAAAGPPVQARPWVRRLIARYAAPSRRCRDEAASATG